MQFFLQPVTEMLRQLESTGKDTTRIHIIIRIHTYTHAYIGIEVHPHGMPAPFQMKMVTICACLDLPARASVLNVVQFNGLYGCNFCEQPGCSCSTEKGGHVHTFPYIQSNPKGPPRTHTGYIEHAKQAVMKSSTVCHYIIIDAYMHADSHYVHQPIRVYI